MLAAAGALAIGIWGVIALIEHANAPKAALQQLPPAGTFRPTAQQWANLSVVPVIQRGFTQGLKTDGKIATDDDRTVQVFSPLSGRVLDVRAKVGDLVAHGQPLFVVTATETTQAQTDLVAAVALLKVAQAAADRQESLLKIQGAALKDVQQSQADLANAKAGLQAVYSRLSILGVPQSQIAAMERRADNPASPQGTPVKAPITGVVVQRALGLGQNIASVTNNGGSTPAFTISDLNTVWLVANVREVDAGMLRLGATVTAHVAAFPKRVFLGRVDFISPSVDPNTRRITVRAAIANSAELLRPEMFADLTVATGPTVVSAAVPEAAVIYEGDKARVWVANPDRTLALKTITAGQTCDGFVEIKQGLQTGNQVVTAGAIFIDRAATNE